MKKFALCSFLILLTIILPPSVSSVEENRVVRYNFPAWENVTELDGSGLYIKLIEVIFGAVGYKSIRQPDGDIPWKKSVQNIMLGNSDTTGAEYKKLLKRRGLIHLVLSPRNSGNEIPSGLRILCKTWHHPGSQSGILGISSYPPKGLSPIFQGNYLKHGHCMDKTQVELSSGSVPL